MSPPADISPPPRSPPPRKAPSRRSVLLWVSLAFVGLVLVAGAALYAERLSIAERLFRGALAERGLDAELRVERFALDELVLGDVVLREGGREVLRARRVVAGYEFRRALDGDIRRVDLDGARIRIGLDEEFRIADGWLQPSGNGGPPVLPREGIGVSDSEVVLATPLGTFDLLAEAEVETVDSFTARLDLRPTTAAGGNWRAAVETAELAVARTGDRVEVVGGAALDSVVAGDATARGVGVVAQGQWSLADKVWTGTVAARADEGRAAGGDWRDLELEGTPRVALSPTTVTGPLRAQLESYTSQNVAAQGLVAASSDLDLRVVDGAVRVSGPIRAQAESVQGFDAEAGQLDVSGTVARLDTSGGLALEGALDIAAERFALAPSRANQFAVALSLEEVLGVAPVTRDFASGLRAEIGRALRGGRLDAGLRVSREDTTEVHLTRPATLGGARQVSVSPFGERPAYAYDPDTDTLQLALEATLDGPRALRVSELNLEARSASGLSVDAVRGARLRLRTSAWTALTPDGRDTTVEPLDVRVDSTPIRTVLRGDLAYSGDVPGGYVRGLRTGGELVVRPDSQMSGQLRTDYATGTPITFDTLLLPTGARVEDFSATLAPSDAPVFTGAGDDGGVAARLEDAGFRYLYEADGTAQDIGIRANALDVGGELRGEVQTWDVRVAALAVDADSLLGPTTTMSAERATLSATLAPEQDLRFAFDAPSLRADTPLAKVRAMRVSASGTPTDFAVDYGGGRVRAPNPTVPVLPLEGTARFADGQWTGGADVSLAANPGPPVAVEFDYTDGTGTAEIVVDSLVFTPDGLQPQTFIPALAGKIADVRGPVSARVRLEFRDGEVVRSPATVQLEGLDLGTQPGPFRGIETELEFDSLLPLQSSGRQLARFAEFNPGLPLRDGEMEFAFTPDGIRVFRAGWPLGGGTVSLEPFTWTYGAEVNRAVLAMDGVPVSEFLDGVAGDRIQLTGTLQGRLPIEVRGVEVVVVGGRLEIPEGGNLQYALAQTDTASAQNAVTKLAFDALRDFDYERFALEVDGPLDGEITLELAFRGSVGAEVGLPIPKWVRLRGEVPFVFDISLTGELFNIVRSLDQSQYAQQGLDRLDPRLRDGLTVGKDTTTTFGLGPREPKPSPEQAPAE